MTKLVLTLSLITISMGFVSPETFSSRRSKEGLAVSVQTDKLPVGVWGGRHINAEVTDKGATFEFDCASGSIDQPIVLDAKGAFQLEGSFAPEHPGPVQRDQAGQSRRVRYAGKMIGEELTLTMTALDNKEDLGAFTLTHGNEGRLTKCR
jgi:hypothetical protein